MNEKRYLVYRNWNGQIHASIEYGKQHTGDGVKKDPNVLKQYEIENPALTSLDILKKLYPLENINNEQT